MFVVVMLWMSSMALIPTEGEALLVVTILLKVPLDELLWYCCELGGLGWVDGACSEVLLCAKCI